MPSHTVLVRGARQLVTLRGPKRPRYGPEMNDLGVIPDGALLIRDGIVVDVGASRRVENLAGARDAYEINAAGRIVMPGFVDSHTHLLFPPPNVGPQSDRDAARLIANVTADRLAVKARSYLHAMVRHGSTTVEIKTGSAAGEAEELKLLRVAAALHGGPVDVIPTFLFRLLPPDITGAESDDSRHIQMDLLPKIHRRRLAQFADVAWDAGSGRHLHFARYLRAARQLGLGCKVHAAEGSARAAITVAVENFATSVDHLENADNDDARLLAGTPTIATLTPAVPFYRGGDQPPARPLIEAGAAVALATNFNPRHTPVLSMQTVVSLARLRLGMSAGEAICAATINGAYALNCGARVGSLEPGKEADLVLLNAGDYREMAQQVGANLVRITMKRGVIVYQEGVIAPNLV